MSLFLNFLKNYLVLHILYLIHNFNYQMINYLNIYTAAYNKKDIETEYRYSISSPEH